MVALFPCRISKSSSRCCATPTALIRRPPVSATTTTRPASSGHAPALSPRPLPLPELGIPELASAWSVPSTLLLFQFFE